VGARALEKTGMEPRKDHIYERKSPRDEHDGEKKKCESVRDSKAKKIRSLRTFFPRSPRDRGQKLRHE